MVDARRDGARRPRERKPGVGRVPHRVGVAEVRVDQRPRHEREDLLAGAETELSPASSAYAAAACQSSLYSATRLSQLSTAARVLVPACYRLPAKGFKVLPGMSRSPDQASRSAFCQAGTNQYPTASWGGGGTAPVVGQREGAIHGRPGARVPRSIWTNARSASVSASTARSPSSSAISTAVWACRSAARDVSLEVRAPDELLLERDAHHRVVARLGERLLEQDSRGWAVAGPTPRSSHADDRRGALAPGCRDRGGDSRSSRARVVSPAAVQ